MSTTMWNPTRHEDYDALKGFAVYTSDNERLGKITEICHPALEMPSARGKHYFRVDPGPLRKLCTDADEVFVPERLVSMIELDDDKVILEVPKSGVEQTDWSRPRDYETYRRF